MFHSIVKLSPRKFQIHKEFNVRKNGQLVVVVAQINFCEETCWETKWDVMTEICCLVGNKNQNDFIGIRKMFDLLKICKYLVENAIYYRCQREQAEEGG